MFSYSQHYNFNLVVKYEPFFVHLHSFVRVDSILERSDVTCHVDTGRCFHGQTVLLFGLDFTIHTVENVFGGSLFRLQSIIIISCRLRLCTFFDGLEHLVFFIPDSLRSDGVLTIRVITIVVQPNWTERIRQDGTCRRSNDHCDNCHRKKNLTPVNPLRFYLGTDFIIEQRLGFDESGSADSGLYGSFGNPGKSEEHLLVAGEFGLACSDDRSDPSHANTEKDDED